MDAVKFLKEALNFCKKQPSCDACELLNEKMMFTCALNISEDSMSAKDPEKLVGIIERWSAEHPVKTRQSEFLKMFPNAKMLNGVISVNPCEVDTENCGVDSESEWCQKCDSCESCHKDYWLAEVE